MTLENLRFVSFKEDRKIISALDALAKLRGTDRSSIIRGLIRKEVMKVVKVE